MKENQDNNLTKEDLLEYLTEIFETRVNKERKIRGLRGCRKNGWIELDTLPCDDPDCKSCRMFNNMLEEEAKKFMKDD